jgi:NAD(P)-dependent dehydrogenase (short-subunit alcohol dehydrogenase family)
MAAPTVLDYGDPARASGRVAGPIAASFAAIAIWEVTRGVRWAVIVPGVWLVIAPLLLDFASGIAVIVSLLSGLVLIACAPISGAQSQSFGAGWRGLVGSTGAQDQQTAGPGVFMSKDHDVISTETEPRTEKLQINGRPKGKVVVITGASAGVGRATARAFAQPGAKLGLIARGRAGLDGAREDVERAGAEAMTIQADVSDAEAVEAAAERVEREFGPIDVWVNDAMLSVFSPVKEMHPDEFRRVTEVTYLGYVYGTLAALKRMLPRDQGTIIQVGSALAYRGIPLQSAYCASKHAIQGFTEALRCELLHDGSHVRVSMVQMPALNTPQFDWVKSRLPNHPQPVPPIFQPEVAAQAIVHASEHYRREWYVGFPTTEAIIGNKIAPGLLDEYLARTNYKAQQTDQPKSPARQNNLWSPVDDDRDFGAHGDFDARARDSAVQWWLTTHRGWLAGAGAVVVGATGALVAAMKR